MNAAPQKRMNSAEFLAWADRQAEGRYELVGGHVVAMSPERVAHTRTKAAAWLALSTALKQANLPCEAFADGVSVVVDRYGTREPDAAVQCGEGTDPAALALDRPLVVVEVVSPSTETIDRDVKLREYFSVATIRHYLIVDAEARSVTHHRRSGTNSVQTTVHADGRINLDPPGFWVAVEDFFWRP